MQGMVDLQQYGADNSREHDQQECDCHDDVDVVQADGIHQHVAETPLRREHLAQKRANERQREADSDASKNLRQRGW